MRRQQRSGLSRPFATLRTAALVLLATACVHRVPVRTNPPPARPAPSEPAEPAPGQTPIPTEAPQIVFPLVAEDVRFTSGFGDPRDGGVRSHKGQDLFCARWTPILAAVDGRVDWLLDAPPPPGKGYRILLRGDDGYLYYYEHLNNDDPGTRDNSAGPHYAYARGLRNGDRVRAGEIIGYVGDSGNAEPAGPHLHFEIHRGTWGNAIDPAPALREALARRKADAALVAGRSPESARERSAASADTSTDRIPLRTKGRRPRRP